ncbi:ATP/GTP-binding protein [Streptomyces paludis]|uniref:ATP/GTP-binding protein n=1 Tax=Streptomyces paludis TaxID=2282738 RepID=A0A345HV59_9ACTN|nr:ATP/GTP-binding protein [Streptomyces paludis]AXG80583.1 ATP/GTP-binding protein [Streptomyces paludis]
MDTDGTGTHNAPPGPVPAPTGSVPPLPRPAAPPRPSYAPAPPSHPPAEAAARSAAVSLDDWLRTPRRAEAPGVWGYGHVPRPPEKPDGVPHRQLFVGVLISVFVGTLVWTLWRNGYIPYRLVPLKLFTPGDWWYAGSFGGPRTQEAARAVVVYEALLFGLLVYVCARLGNWAELFRRHVARRGQPFRAAATAAGGALALLLVWQDILPVARPVLIVVAWIAGGELFQSQNTVNVIYVLISVGVLWPFARLGEWRALVARYAGARATTGPGAGAGSGAAVADGAAHPDAEAAAPSPAEWPELRAAGQRDAAETLAAEARAGGMNDVDCARLRRAWSVAAARPERIAAFTEAVLRKGAAACPHPSGDRDLPQRTARHDLLTGQVRIGSCADDPHNPYERRGSGVALEPALLGTSLLAVGPPGAGKSGRLVRPLVESLALQALAGQAAVVAVCAAGTPLGPDSAYDVVIKIGDPASPHDLDLYGGTTDPDEAAAVLAEGLAGDVGTVDGRRAASALAQLIGPYRAAHGHFPAVPVLRELLDGDPAALTGLRAALTAADDRAMLRELDARARQAGGAGDPGPLLSDRLALLDRPAFAEFFATGARTRVFSLRSLEGLPVRVRIELPERAHAEASRLLARLVLAQFTAVAAARTDRSLFICLVLDDATHTLTPETVRGVRRLRSVNAGAVLALRTIDDVAEGLHTALLGAVGCCMAFSGVTTWDGKRFAEVWGKEWVETREVAQHTVFADQPFTRAVHALRKLVTGKAVTTDAVTVRQVERERWSASELAYEVPAGHAVLSLRTVAGDHAPPLLVDLRG